MNTATKTAPMPELPRNGKRDTTADQILDAAVECIAEMGARKCSMSDIAKRAGIVRSTVYRHFPRMQDIILRAALRDLQDVLARLGIVLDNSPDAEDMIVESFIFFLRELPRRPVLKALISQDPDMLQQLSIGNIEFNTLGAQFAQSTYDRAVEEGRLRDGLSLEDYVDWLARIMVSLVTAPHAKHADGLYMRQYFHKVLVPSVLKDKTA